MKEIIRALEQVSRSVKSDQESVKPAEAVKALRERIREARATAGEEIRTMLAKLDEELSVWQSKMEVILKEPVGRQGMARHAAHWRERINALNC